MAMGALLVLALAAGGYAAFAQTEGDAAQRGAQITPPQDGPAGARVAPAFAQDGPALAHGPGRGRGPGGARVDVDEAQLLADALGITVEELEAAREAVREAIVEQAVAEGLITEAQAEALLEANAGPRAAQFLRRLIQNNMEIDSQQLLADALGITVEELQAAQREVQEAKLAAMVEAGILTEEEAEMIAARRAVQEYVDREAIAEMVRNSLEAAINEALADGAITQEQADQMLEHLENFDGFRFNFGPGRPGHGPGHHRGGPGGPGGQRAPAFQPGPGR